MPINKQQKIRTFSKWLDNIAVSIFALLFLIAMNYVGRNLGGAGIELPYNNFTWIFAASFILIALMKIGLSSRVRYSNSVLWYLLALFMLLLPLSYTERLFLDVATLSLSGLGAGFLFFIALGQFNTKNTKEKILIILLISSLIQTAWGLVQYYLIYEVHFLFYRADKGFPYGVFQQVNDYTSYLAIGSLLSIYFLFNHSRKAWWQIALVGFLLLVNFHLSELAMSGTAKVVALISLVTYLIYISVQHKQYLVPLLFLVISLAGYFAPREWFDIRPELLQVHRNAQGEVVQIGNVASDGSVKSDSMPINQGAEKNALGTRVTIYTVALRMIMDKPLVGHGIHSFTKQYLLYQGDYLKENPGAPAEFALNHAHNEILHWAIELGVVSASAFFILLFAWIYMCYKRQMNLGVLLVALPLVLHSMFELPFYHSAPHFLAFMAILLAATKGSTKVFRLPKLTKFVVIPATIWAFVQVQIFLLSTMYALQMFLQFDRVQRQDISYLLQVNNSAAFKLRFEFELMQFKLREAAKERKITKKDLLNYIYWAFSTTQYAPMPITYENFVETLRLYGNDEAALKFASEGVHMYPINEKLRRYEKELQEKLGKLAN